MIVSALKNVNMANNHDSLRFNTLQRFNKKEFKLSSISVIWDSVSENADCKLKVLGSNNINSSTKLLETLITSNNNLDDALLLILQADFNFIQIKYESNNTLTGILNVDLFYG